MSVVFLFFNIFHKSKVIVGSRDFVIVENIRLAYLLDLATDFGHNNTAEQYAD